MTVHGLMMLADDAPEWKLDPVEQARAACAGGATTIQLRVKHATDATALAWARAIRSLTRESGARFFFNDRFDLALASEADGVHLGQNDIPPDRIPKRLRDGLSIGRSTHTLAQARAAIAEPIRYVAFGPVFGTDSKASEYAPRGLDALAEIVAVCAPLPVVAIGGIGVDNAADVARAGAASIAVISAVAQASDPVAAARALTTAWTEANR